MTQGPLTDELCTLGDLHLGSFRKVKSLLMLAYVALEGPTPRRDIRTLLWPNARQPESSLRVALYVLREAVPGALEGDERLDTAVPCDAARLLTLRGHAALDAYPGAFLGGVTPGDVSTEFDEWVEGWRARLARHVQGEALALAESADPARAEALAERAYRVPGAPPADPELLGRLLALTLPGSAVETELRAELRGLTGPDDVPALGAARTGRMLGRAAPLDALLAWAARPGGAVAAVSGPGGIGKSTLSREVLRELTRTGGNAVLVDAEGARSGADLLPRLASARAPGQAVQGTWAGLAPLLGDAPVVLLDGVDDLEDLGELLLTLRRDLPHVRWVLSGRRRRLGQLTRPGDRAAGPDDTLALVLDGLDVPPPDAALPEVAASSAVALFLREAARVRRDFALTPDNAGVIGSVARRLLGHPLALALAASWLRVDSLEGVYARVLQEAATLSSPGGDHDGRRGLMLVARRSWDLLDERERGAALRLGVCADFDPADAAALGVSDAELDALLAHSFVEAYLPGSERLRVYPALTGLLDDRARAQPAIAHAARRAHARHYLTRFLTQVPESPAVDAERSNLRLAMSSALQDGTLTALTIEHLLAHYDRRGLLGSGTDVFAALADEAEDAGAGNDVQAAAQIACMWLAYRAGRLLDAQTLAARFLQGPLASDPAGRMKVLNTLASVRGQQGQYRAANDLFRQAIALAEQLGQPVRAAMYRMNQLTHLLFLEPDGPVLRDLADVERSIPDLPEPLGRMFRRVALQLRLYLPGSDVEALLAEAHALAEEGRQAGDLTTSTLGLAYAVRLHLRRGDLRRAKADLATLRAGADRFEGEEEVELALLETEFLYARARTPEARRSAVGAAGLLATSPNPWAVIELFLITAQDLGSLDRPRTEAFLALVAHSATVTTAQRHRAGELSGGAASADGVLEVTDLREWLVTRLRAR